MAARVVFVARGSTAIACDKWASAPAQSPAKIRALPRQVHAQTLSVKRDKVMAQVEMACGSQRIVSLMSRESADQLGLKPGVSATAVIKATTVIVERP